ncbi:ABC transporter permease [Spiroplasma endosymbiont of Polydrusus cervinus]|uniref:ABC transporter permease n=1 Tax=Spiroplasma endosymbiont of Polydrusus cervinus TaxID=3066287 RepID=UPI0030CB25F6
MRQILKSYLKSYFKNWIEAGGLILFIIIIIATIAGILSGALQYKIKYNDLTYTSEKWDYALRGRAKDYKNNFLKDYYLNNKFVNKNQQVINVTGTPQAILAKNSGWWRTVQAVCKTLPSIEMQKICRTQQIIIKLDKIGTSRGINQQIDGINPIAWWYLKQYNYNRSKELTTRLLSQQPAAAYSGAGFFETISFKQETGENYTFNITPAVVKNLEKTGNVNFNQLKLYQGRLPLAVDETVVSSLFAKQNHFQIGDILPVIPQQPKFDLKIVGIGNNLDNFVKRTNLKVTNNNDIRKYGVLFTTAEFQARIQDANVRGELGTIKLNHTQKSLIKLNHPNATLTLKENLGQAYINPTATLVPYEDNYIALQTQNINIQIILYSSIGAVLLFLEFLFINYTMKKEMNKTRRQIGIFKAFGYQSGELSWIFSTKFFMTMLFGIVIGYCFSIPIQLYVNTLYTTGLLIPFKLIYVSWWFMFILFFVIPIFFTALFFLFTISYLKKPSLVLINVGGKVHFYALMIGIKKIFSKSGFLFRIQLAFFLKEFWKWMIVMFIFFVSYLMFIIQFNASDIFSDIVQAFSNVYQKDVDHRFQFPNTLTMATSYKNPSGEDKLQLINTNHFRVLPTSDVEQTQVVSLTKFNELATAIHHEPANIKLWEELAVYQPIYKSVYLTDLIQVFKDLINLNPSKIKIPTWAKNILNLSSLIDQTKVKTVVSFNTLYYHPQTELPILNLSVTPSNRETAVISDLSLWGIEPQTWSKFYQIEGVDPMVIKNLFAAPLTRTNIPAIISEKIAKLNNLGIGDSFELTVKNAATSYNLTIIVQEINKNDTTRSNVFINTANIRFLFCNIEGKPVEDLYNGVISKEKMIYDKINPKDLLTGKQNYKITLQNLTINIFNYDITDNLENIFLTLTSDGSDIGVFTSPDNAELITLQKLLANAGLGMLNDSLLILQMLNGIIIFIILAVITLSVIDEASQIILTMWALGYKPCQVNFIVIGNYVLGVLFTFVLAYIISLLIWHFAINIILQQFKFVINLPLNWQTPVKVGVIINLILVLSWFLSMYLVKKQKLNELTE